MPYPSRRATLRGAMSLAATAALSKPALAQLTWPTNRITITVGFATGGFADTVARVIAKELAERLSQPVVVQNLPGAGGNTASRSVSVAKPDGYSLLVSTTALAINDTLYKSKIVSLDTLMPLAIPVNSPESLSSNAKGDIKSLKDLERVSREGRLFVGTAGIGSGSHIASEYFFKKLANLKSTHIPFQGGANALYALLNGDITVLATTAGAATNPAIMRGELIGLGVAGRQRVSTISAVPTFIEQGYANFEASSWVGFFAPAGTPPEIAYLLNKEINAALDARDAKAKFDQIGLATIQRDRSATDAFFRGELARWSEMVKTTGISM